MFLPLLLLVPMAFLALVAFLLLRRFLVGPDLSQYDLPATAPATSRTEPSPEVEEVENLLRRLGEEMGPLTSRGRLKRVRKLFDDGFGFTKPPAELGVEVREVSLPGNQPEAIRGEWVIAPDYDPKRRLLYLHGGAFFIGSPRSHRAVTSALARRTGTAVFAVDYRLLPEATRKAGIRDCQAAYRWFLDNGPDGPGPAEELFISGDSAGGNLALMLIAWARNQNLRAVNAAAVIAPATDGSLTSPTIRENLETDLLLGRLFRLLRLFPRTFVLWNIMLLTRMHPRNPLLAPLEGTLSNLPPTLVHASESEILLGDARRWVNKARQEGTEATLQTWPGLPHVWHVFNPQLPEADEALAEIAAFFARHGNREQDDRDTPTLASASA